MPATFDFQADPSTGVADSPEAPQFDFQPDTQQFDFQPDAQQREQQPSTPETNKALGLTDRINKFFFTPEGAQTLRTAIQGAVSSIPDMAMQLPKMAYEAAKFQVGGPQEQAQVATKAISEGVAIGQQTAKDIQAPFGTPEFLRGAGQIAMMAAPGAELVRELRAPAEIPLEKPPIQGEPNAIEPSNAQMEAGPTTQRVQEGTAGVEPSTSSSDYALGEAQGETGTLPQQPVSTGETVATAPPETNAPRTVTAELPEGWIEEGLHTEYPEIGAKMDRYIMNNDASGIFDTLKDPRYPEYHQDLQRILQRTYGNEIPVSRISGYGTGGTGQSGGLAYVSVSTNPRWGEAAAKQGYEIWRGTVKPEDVVAAGHESEGELIVKKSGIKTEPNAVRAVSSGKTVISELPFRPAVRLENGEVYLGRVNHVEATEAATKANGGIEPNVEPGWVDRNGKFLTRTEAATKAGELAPKIGKSPDIGAIVNRRGELISRYASEKSQQPAPQPITAELPTGGAPIGAANRVAQARSEAGLLGEEGAPPPGIGSGWHDSVTEGNALIDQGADPYKIVSQFQSDGQISGKRMNVARAWLERLQRANQEARGALEADPQNPDLIQKAQASQDAENSFWKGYQPMKTEWSKIGTGMQETRGITDADLLNQASAEQVMREHLDRELTDSDKARVAKVVKDTREANASSNGAFDKAIDHASRSAKGPVRSLDALRKDLADTLKEITC